MFSLNLHFSAGSTNYMTYVYAASLESIIKYLVYPVVEGIFFLADQIVWPVCFMKIKTGPSLF